MPDTAICDPTCVYPFCQAQLNAFEWRDLLEDPGREYLGLVDEHGDKIGYDRELVLVGRCSPR